MCVQVCVQWCVQVCVCAGVCACVCAGVCVQVCAGVCVQVCACRGMCRSVCRGVYRRACLAMPMWTQRSTLDIFLYICFSIVFNSFIQSFWSYLPQPLPLVPPRSTLVPFLPTLQPPYLNFSFNNPPTSICAVRVLLGVGPSMRATPP